MNSQTHTLSPVTTQAPLSDAGPIVGGRVELQLLTTLKCNLKCSYCSLGVGEVLGSQTELKYDIEQLAAFIERHLGGKEIYVTFYGGEPTLNREMMETVMRRFPSFRYQLQTNGTLLDNLPDWMLHKLSNILVSIDGGEQTTDGYRGRGVWRQVHRNVNHVRDRAEPAEALAVADRREQVPPVERAADREAQVLDRVHARVAQRKVVHERHVPEPDEARVCGHRRRRVGEDPGPPLDHLNALRDRAQEHLVEAENQQDRDDVEQQDVLNHVHQQELVPELVDRRDERREDCDQPEREHHQTPVAGPMRRVGGPSDTPQLQIGDPQSRHAQKHHRLDGPGDFGRHD